MKIPTERDASLGKLHPNTTEALLKFNITKQRVVDLCNEDRVDDPFDQEISYSSWHRAMDGKWAVDVVVNDLDALHDMQAVHPERYLPADIDYDDLRTWMRKFAGATWWHKTLKLKMSRAVLNNWFSERTTRDEQEIVEAVRDWWTQVQAAVQGAVYYTTIQERNYATSPTAKSWDTWAKDQLEDGLPLEGIKASYIKLQIFERKHHLRIIDLAAPSSPTHECSLHAEIEQLYRDSFGKEFDKMVEDGFPNAISRTPPAFEKTEIIEHRWGDRRHEECPKDLNEPLYEKYYRRRLVRGWDQETRQVVVESDQVVEVSEDGQNWREPTERERQGWVGGTLFFFEALHEGGDTSNSYSRELQEASMVLRTARFEYDRTGTAEAAAKLDRAEEYQEMCRQNTCGQFDV